MSETKFNINEIEKTFTKYKTDTIVEGIVVIKQVEGIIFNIGGKADAFIPAGDVDNYDDIKIGDTFKVMITNTKNTDGYIEVSKAKADKILFENQNAEKLRIGSIFSFVVTKVTGDGLTSKLGQYDIFIPYDEIGEHFLHSKLENKYLRALVTEINHETKEIIASTKILFDKEKETAETNFWKSIFINKVVFGKVEKIMPYGAFINVDGISCLVHISDLSYSKTNSVEEVLKVGEEYKFRVIKVDKINKKVSLGIKQLEESPKLKELNNFKEGDIKNGTVLKLLPFGAIVKISEHVDGLLHINDATEDRQKKIYEIVKVDDKISVKIKNIDITNQRVSLSL